MTTDIATDSPPETRTTEEIADAVISDVVEEAGMNVGMATLIMAHGIYLDGGAETLELARQYAAVHEDGKGLDHEFGLLQEALAIHDEAGEMREENILRIKATLILMLIGSIQMMFAPTPDAAPDEEA